jgi:predicted DsbA family dithiol-disulfide isomerase
MIRMPEPITLEVFSDYVCPWCYLGDNRVKKLKRNFDLTVQLVHFPLHPDTPAEGRAREDFKTRKSRVQDLIEAEGLPYGARSHTYNSRLAQEIGTWAETQPGGNAIHDKFFEAYFVDCRNIGDVEVIIDVVKSAGLDEQQARAVLAERRFKDAVDADWEKSRRFGVTGVPTFVSNGQGLVGAQPYEVLEKFIAEAGAQRRSD